MSSTSVKPGTYSFRAIAKKPHHHQGISTTNVAVAPEDLNSISNSNYSSSSSNNNYTSSSSNNNNSYISKISYKNYNKNKSSAKSISKCSAGEQSTEDDIKKDLLGKELLEYLVSFIILVLALVSILGAGYAIGGYYNANQRNNGYLIFVLATIVILATFLGIHHWIFGWGRSYISSLWYFVKRGAILGGRVFYKSILAGGLEKYGIPLVVAIAVMTYTLTNKHNYNTTIYAGAGVDNQI